MNRRIGLSPFIAVTAVSLLGLAACQTAAKRPCSEAYAPGQGPRGQSPTVDGELDKATLGKGNKKCEQQRDATGKFMNHGTFTEFHSNGQRAIEGEYYWGVRTGKWREWDERGKLTRERWFEKGVETTTRDKDQRPAGAPPPPLAPPKQDH
jgi:hypothetical protein